MKRHFHEWSVAVFLAGLLIFLVVTAPNFFEPQPLLSRLTSAAPKLMVACGIAMVMITRQIDISVGSLFTVCSVATGLMVAAKLPLAVAATGALVIGALGGAINGTLVAGLRLPSIVVTLATMVTWREALRLYQQGVFVNLPEPVQWFGLSMRAGQAVICLSAFLLLVALTFGLRNLGAGRLVYAAGSDFEAARLAGISPRTVSFWVFVMTGALVGLAAVLNLVQSPQVDPSTGKMLELESIAAAVVGGIAIAGGRGNLWGVLAGFLLLTCISPALTYMGVKPYWDKAIQGMVILLAVVADGLRRRNLSKN